VSVLRFVMYAVLIMIVVDKLGFQTTSLLTLFGSAALAIGMSLQGSLSNFAGGILILIFKPFKVGDYIVVGDKEGTVKSIEILYTRITTIDNKVIMLPNGTLSNSSIVNVGAENTRRVDIEIGIGYSSDIPTAKRLLEDVVTKEPGVLKDKDINVVVKRLDESCVTLETRAWVNTADYWNVRFNLLEKYKSIFDENGIEIPFNQLDVHMK
ncbi:MAG: mechanosensitive ion channel family protein, partial [Lachnospira sp.]|nr:mechanosensitive ion channel family protein [Lachnospira sp.]